MTDPHLDPDDIAPSAAAEGAAFIGWGTIVESGTGDRGTAAFVSEHERLHVNLNLATAYGVLLRACAIHSPSNLEPLVEFCRTTHETYATYLGIWVALDRSLEVLADFPDYVRYFDLGQQLAREFRAGSIAARNTVSAAARAAMHAPVAGLAAQLGRGELEIPETTRPDVRFAVVCESAPEVRSLLGSFPAEWLDQPIEETLDFEHVATFKAETTRLNRLLFERFAEVLRSRGFPTLDWDANERDEDLTAVTQLGGARAELPPSLNLRGGEDDPHNPTHLNLRVFDGERWIQRGAPAAAVAMHFLDVPGEAQPGSVSAEYLVGSIQGENDVFIVVRPLRQLLSQYELDEQSRRVLAVGATNGVVTAVRRTVRFQNRSTALLALLSSTSELERLSSLGTGVGILSSVSLACVSVPEWRQYWLSPLHTTSEIILSCDIALTHWLEISEAETTPASLRYECQGALTDHTDTSTQILAVEYDEAGKVDTRQLILGSPTAVASLALALDQSPSITATHDTRMVPASRVWRGVIARLLEEEPWFDRRGFEHLTEKEDKSEYPDS